MPGVLVNKVYDFKGHRDAVFALAPADGEHFFSSGGDGLIAGWNMHRPDQGDLIARVPNSVYALHYIPERKILAVGHNQDGVHFIDVEKKKETASIKLTANSIFDIQPYNNLLFIGDGDGSIFIIDAIQYKTIQKISACTQSVRCIAINHLTKELAAGFSDNHIRIYSLNDYSLKYEWPAHEKSVFGLRFSPDNKFLISVSRDAHIRKWKAYESYQMSQDVVGHIYAINNLAFSPDGKHFITCSMDKTIKIWRADDMKLLKVIDHSRHAGHRTSINKVLWLSEHRIISASDDRNISVWDIHIENQ